MKAPARKRESISEVRLDLASAKILVWIASVGRDADLTSEAHIYFFDRYQKLADYHRRRGRAIRAHKLQGKADEHYRLGGGDGPPYAAAMVMPRPKQWFTADVVSDHRVGGPDDAAQFAAPTIPIRARDLAATVTSSVTTVEQMVTT